MRFNIFNAHSFLPPEGIAASSKCIVVGDYPNYHEARAGKMFDGAAGRVLQNCMANADLIRNECYITYVIKDIDRPVDARYDFKKGTFSADCQQYIALLQEEIQKCDAKFIVAFGEIPLRALTSREGIYKWRGSVIESTLVPGKWVIPAIHPRTVPPPSNVFLNRYLITFDLKRLARWIKLGKYLAPNAEIKIRPTFQEIMSYLERLKAKKLVATDIEILNEEVSCISLSHSPNYAMCIPFCDAHSDLWTADQEVRIWEGLDELFGNTAITKLGQNITFDTHFILRKYGIVIRPLLDTMVAQQIISPDFPKGLDFITSVHTEFPYYKDDGKRWFKVGGAYEQLWHYNALDSLICIAAHPNQLKEITNAGNLPTYERQCNILEPLVYMQEHGIRADMEGINKEYAKQMEDAENYQNQLNAIAGQELNAKSPLQLKKYFYDYLKIKPYKEKGKISTGELAMKRIARRGFKEAKLVLNIRKTTKVASTYLAADKFDADQRIRCSYNPVGTRYSRISSSKNIFGTGMNLQNWTHQMLQYLMADEHYVGYAMDLSQAENRIVAILGNVTAMIKAFNEGKDVHSLTASLIFGDPPEVIKQEDVDKVLCTTLGDGQHTKRFWGKKCNHGLNYDLGPNNFALRYEIPQNDGKYIVDKYHKIYPGVRKTFHAYVKNCLHTDRTLTNLMGRRTLFLGPLEDATYKEAYSCIPQGTVGDVINERGMNYVYYNQDLFGPVELLSQVHDEIVFQIPSPDHPTNPVSWEDHAQMLKLIKVNLETPLTFQDRTFVIPVDTTMFKRFKKGTDISSAEMDQPLTTVEDKLAECWEYLNTDAMVKNLP